MQGLSDRVAVERRSYNAVDADGFTTYDTATRTIAARVYTASAVESFRADRYSSDIDLVIDCESWASIAPEDLLTIDDHDARAGTYEVVAVEPFPPHMQRAFAKRRS